MQLRAAIEADVSGSNYVQEKVINIVCRIILKNGLAELKQWVEANKDTIDLKALDAKSAKVKKILKALNNLYSPKDLISERWRAVFKQLLII
jgi:hypothetical protein